MKKFYWFVIAVSFVFSACQSNKNLIIVNDSDEKVEIQYQLKASIFQNKKSGFAPEVITVMTVNYRRYVQESWKQIPEEQYNFDQSLIEYTVSAEPHQAIKIGWINPNYLKESDIEYFDVKTLKIKGSNKEIDFDDSKKLLAEFQKNDYQINYK